MTYADASLWHSERKTSTQVEHYIVVQDDKDTISFILEYNSETKLVVAKPYTPPDINYTFHYECVLDDPESWQSQEYEEANDYARAVRLLEANVKQQRIAESLLEDKRRLQAQS